MRSRQLCLILLILATAFLCLEEVAPSIGDEPRKMNFLYPAKEVDPAVLKSDDQVVVTDSADCWSFVPAKGVSTTALLFYPGGGVESTAYAPLARLVAAEGLPVHLMKLPGKIASLDKHRQEAMTQGKLVIKANSAIRRWVVSGHSMGGSIAARFVHEAPSQFQGLILLGTTHPRDFDLSKYTGDVTKVYGTEDSVAKQTQSEANKKLLPAKTTWVRIEGGNHAQFGCYGSQFGDGKATISREQQQQTTSKAMIEALQRISKQPE